MGLFSRKNKEFSGSPNSNGRDSLSDDGTSPTGTHRHNTLHKRPPVPVTNDAAATEPSNYQSPTSATAPVDDQSQAYEDGGVGVAGTRNAGLAASNTANDPYVNGTATGLSGTGTNAGNTGSTGRRAATVNHQRDMATGNPGVMSNQTYDKNATGVGAGAGMAGVGTGMHQQNNNAGSTAQQGSAGGANGQNFSNDPNLQPYMASGGAGAGGNHRMSAALTVEAARAKLSAAEETEERALALVAEARKAAQDARETIERYAAQVEEETRLAAMKREEAQGLRQQTEHLGRV